ncbi:MAG: DEAD/DEAH box helicase [Ignavibacteriae bacterium]|nr:DEAD/DEAH box helicase [Ignavibacteriota bacterium]
MKSASLKLSKHMIALLERHGITTPTPIQREIIPAIFDKRDVLAQSETGSGKTISFAIPLIEQLNRSDGLSVLVLVPTRELCIQVTGEFVKFSEGKHLGVTSVYGGVSINEQVKKMRTTNIIVATPGRLLDLLNRRALTLDTIRSLVLDEADRMLDMGFIRDIEKILSRIPTQHQTLLFSATVSKEIEQLSRKYLKNPVNVKLASEVKPEFLQQTYYQTTPEEKLPLLVELLKRERDLTLVFCNRKHFASKLARRLAQHGIHARSLHGDMSQNQRERVSNEFRKRKINVLVATDVAARGLHIEGISHVYNYEIPRDVDSYTHRVGRTARAGKTGEAISFVSTGDEQKFFKNILFNYQGRITLQKFDRGILTAPKTGDGQKQGQSRQHRQPSPRKANHRNSRQRHETKRESESKPSDAPQVGKSTWRKRWEKYFR